MAWTNPTTWTTGSVPSAANFNTHIRDNLNAAGDHTAWSTYAATFTCTGSTDPKPSGKYGHYLRVGNLVFYAYRIVIGSTVGNGAYCLSLPVNGNFDNNLRCGSGYLLDFQDGWTTVHYSSSTDASFVKLLYNAKTAVGTVTHATPGANRQDDVFGGFLIYRAAG